MLRRMPFGQIRHRHDLHHQAGPSREMLSPLSCTGLWVVLLPRKSRPLPLVEDVFNQILAERSVDLGRLGLVWPCLSRNVLRNECQQMDALLQR